MASSLSGTVETITSEMIKFLTRLVSFTFTDISFSIGFDNSEGLRVDGKADSISIITHRSSEGSSYILTKLIFSTGRLLIQYYDDTIPHKSTVLDYTGDIAEVDVHLQAFSRKMIASLHLKGTVSYFHLLLEVNIEVRYRKQHFITMHRIISSFLPEVSEGRR
jgi:hypothetical protein